MNANKVIISVAPVAHVGTVIPAGAKNPITPEEIAAEVIGCAAAGASMVHLHVRDLAGEQTFDLSAYTRTLDLIRRETDIVIQGSTGGKSNLTLAERCVSINEPRTQVASLNMGSVNFGEGVYINALPDIRFWIGEMKKNGVAPELEIFDVSMLATIDQLVAEGLLTQPLNYNFCLGFHGAMLADPRHLYYLSSLLPPGSHWGFIHEGMGDYSMLAAALGLGARAVRVGFEDGRHLAPRRVAPNNVELVTRLADLVALLGLEIATPAEARLQLGVIRE
jgi:3-keto-5-aminohexanoate cleavage enzyme